MANFCLFLSIFLCISQLNLVQLVPASKNPLAPYEIYGKTEMIEGDILIKRKQLDKKVKFKNSNRKIGYAASRPDSYLWPNGQIPYVLDPSIPKKQYCLIQSAMLDIMLKSCIYFHEKRPTDQYYIRIYKGQAGDCHATMGRNWGFSEGEVSLGDGCYNFGTIVHELMHTIGFHHEHNRSDRDKYLKIHYENVINGFEWVFKKYKKTEEQIFTKFDFESIMMYHSLAFSKDNHSPTISSKVKGKELKYATKLSKDDVKSINQLYKCSNQKNAVCSKLLNQMKYCKAESKQFLDQSAVQKIYGQCNVS